MEPTQETWLERVSEFLKMLWLYIAGFIAVGAIYFTLTGVEQGIDVVIQAGESRGQGIAALISVPLWAFLVWYSCRLLSYTKQKAGTDIPAHYLQLIPRLLAFNCFVCVQAAIFALPTFCNLTFYQLLLFIIAHNAFYYFLHQWFTYGKKIAAIISLLFIFAIVSYYVYRIAGAKGVPVPERHKLWLPVVGIMLLLLQVLALYLFIWRRKYIDKKMEHLWLTNPDINQKIPREKYLEQETNFKRVFYIFGFISLAIYGAGIFSIRVSDSMGAMAFLLLGLGVLVSFSNYISSRSIKIKINLFLFIFILAIIIGKFRDPYEVRTFTPTQSKFYIGRPDVKTYLQKWVKKREAMLDSYVAHHDTFHVYLVSSDGGASRAGNWVCGVLSTLQDASSKKDTNNTFADHLLAISGASGGSVGNAAFYSMLRARQLRIMSKSEPFVTHNDMFFDGDFLTFTLGRVLGPDFFRHIFPLRSIMDRGAALETVLAAGSDDPVIDTQFNRPLSHVFDTSGELPIFFITTTRVEDGMPSILSPVQLPLNSQRFDVTRLFDSTLDIRLSTAAILSSRFPYLSPAGGIKDNYFVDGGYVDNAGSGIMLDLLQEIEEIAKDTTSTFVKKYRNNIAFHILHIYNSPVSPEHFAPMHPLMNDLVTPLITLAGMQGSSTRISNGAMYLFFEAFNHDTTNAVINFSLYKENVAVDSIEPYPMSWVISAYQLERMKQRRKEETDKNMNKFWFLRQ